MREKFDGGALSPKGEARFPGFLQEISLWDFVYLVCFVVILLKRTA